MAFKYNPKDASSALPADKYPASIATCEEGTSKSSDNPMLTITFTVYTPAGGERTIYDYIVNPTTLWRMKRLAKAIGKATDFEAGTFNPSDHIGANLTLDLGVQEDDEHGDKNTVRGYEPSALGAKTAPTPKAAQSRSPGNVAPVGGEVIQESDIPF